MAFRKLIASLSKVINGDQEEEANLGLKLIKVEIGKLNATEMEVALQHNVLSQVAAAAEVLDLTIVRDTATTGLQLLNLISSAKFKKPLEPLTVDPEDYAQALQGFLLETKSKAEKMEVQLIED